ncbi:hypothetical protein BDC45DRAFT_534212 [Circinella umbellata]|nr:hypothetical protein BDC45DRAFT_534212 [Circinella umbellata]
MLWYQKSLKTLLLLNGHWITKHYGSKTLKIVLMDLDYRWHKNQDETSPVESTSRPSPSSESLTLSPSLQSSPCPTLKTPLEVGDRERIVKLYEELNSGSCWYLDATRQRAELRDIENLQISFLKPPMDRALEAYEYGQQIKHHPINNPLLAWLSQTLMQTSTSIQNFLESDSLYYLWFPVNTIFHNSNIQALGLLQQRRTGGIEKFRHVELVSKFNEIEKLKGALEAYEYGQQIKHYPINDPLLAWLSQTLMQTSKFFIPGSSTSTQKFLESDSLYYLWFPVNTIFHNSNLQALGEEKTSTSHANILNTKRKLSSSLEIEREKIGRRIDTIYIGCDIELGGLEIGARRNNTKEFQDSMLKLPLVLKDMLTEIINNRPSLLRDAHVLGYNINGTGIKLIDIDCFKGNVVRVRRSEELIYPMTNNDCVLKMLSVLELRSCTRQVFKYSNYNNWFYKALADKIV